VYLVNFFIKEIIKLKSKCYQSAVLSLRNLNPCPRGTTLVSEVASRSFWRPDEPDDLQQIRVDQQEAT